MFNGVATAVARLAVDINLSKWDSDLQHLLKPVQEEMNMALSA